VFSVVLGKDYTPLYKARIAAFLAVKNAIVPLPKAALTQGN